MTILSPSQIPEMKMAHELLCRVNRGTSVYVRANLAHINPFARTGPAVDTQL